MSATLLTGLLLIVLPIAFNVAFFALARSFDYPTILREPTDTILTRFAAGGTRLHLTWTVFALVALAFVPIVALTSNALVAPGTEGLLAAATAVGIAAGLVQTLGLVRWPFLVPELARRWTAAAPGSPERATVEVVFASAHRLLGVGIGEHLGYLLTGLWTVLIGLAILAGGGPVPAWLGCAGIPVGLAVALGTLEFLGSHERDGWPVIGTIVPIAYLVWSLWLLVLGVLLVAAG
jgi:hypothetical protein